HNLGYTATFMPKPLFGDNGSGMHVHQSLWKNDTPLFYDESGYALLSETARHYIGGPPAPPPAPPVLLAPPLGHLPDSDLLEQPEGAPGRVPRARSDGQPVPGLLGPAHGRPRRHS